MSGQVSNASNFVSGAAQREAIFESGQQMPAALRDRLQAWMSQIMASDNALAAPIEQQALDHSSAEGDTDDREIIDTPLVTPGASNNGDRTEVTWWAPSHDDFPHTNRAGLPHDPQGNAQPRDHSQAADLANGQRAVSIDVSDPPQNDVNPTTEITSSCDSVAGGVSADRDLSFLELQSHRADDDDEDRRKKTREAFHDACARRFLDRDELEIHHERQRLEVYRQLGLTDEQIRVISRLLRRQSGQHKRLLNDDLCIGDRTVPGTLLCMRKTAYRLENMGRAPEHVECSYVYFKEAVVQVSVQDEPDI